MGIVDSKTFKSGNSVAVRLPKEIAFARDHRAQRRRADDPAGA
jgi:virulence-associated protein VagC